MPEYLSPGVYVEEVMLEARPIEGVSTSTAGMVGVTERGPEDVPILVTSFSEFQRLFGSYLDQPAYPDAWYLPYAVEGFFQNGGQRVYIVRVASPGALPSTVTLMDQASPARYASQLVVRPQDGDAFLVVADATGLSDGETLRVEDGAATEYVTLGPAPFPDLDDRVLALRAPTYSARFGGDEVVPLPAMAPAAAAPAQWEDALAADVPRGANAITVTALPVPPGEDELAPGDVLRIAEPAAAWADELVVVALGPTAADATIRLRQRLAFAHAAGAQVARMEEGAAAASRDFSQAAAAGSGVLVLDAGPSIAAGDVVRIGAAPASDYHVVAELHPTGLEEPAAAPHAAADPVRVLTFTANAGTNGDLAADAAEGDTAIRLVPGDLAEDDWIEIDGPGAEVAQVAAVPGLPADEVQLRQPLRSSHSAGATVVRQAPDAGTPVTTLLQELPAGAGTALLADVTGFGPGTLVEIGEQDASGREHAVLGAALAPQLLPLATPPAPAPPSRVAHGHPPDTLVELREPAFEVHALDRGGWGNGLRVSAEDEEAPLAQTTAHAAGANADVPLVSTTGVESGSLAEILDLTTELSAEVEAGGAEIRVADRTGIVPGDRLRIGRRYPEYAAVAALPTDPPDGVALSAALERGHGAREAVDRMDASGLPRLAKVATRVGAGSVRFDGGGLPFAVGEGWTVRSREFRLTVEWVKPNPRNPVELQVVASETHRHLSLDDRHSRYVGRVIGSAGGPARLWDRRPDGQSDLVRIADPADSEQTHALLRPGPDLIFEVLPSGSLRALPRPLSGGEDDAAGVTDDTFRGVDNVDPQLRTGLESLKNREDISLVAIPGRGTAEGDLQQALIGHCELMRYRFAVLDSLPGTVPTGAQLPEVQAQRARYDTKYAALYYPWLQVRNPFPLNPAVVDEISIPPSGHVVGIYARTDVTRGVHKAPANEVIAGIRGLQRVLTKGEQDILNPSPVNISVLRDFREQNRGLRVWGARVITNDAEWKYVNVRRLFNFIERSIELGTEWSVFEPNDPHLWARVQRSIGDFLTVVWLSGGLMGATAEEAFFVKCDRTTMTQNDLDNGRLIVLVGIAPVKPAEFVVIRIGQWQGGSAVEEV